MQISDRLHLGKTLKLLALVALAACAGTGGPAPKSVKVNVGGTSLVLAAPGALCVDPASMRSNSAGTFALLDDCVALGPTARSAVAPANNGLITVSISPGAISAPSESAEAGLESLRTFLQGPGRPALARSDQRDSVKIVGSAIEDGMLLLQVRDPGAVPVPKLSSTFWRGYTEVRGQTVSASLSTFVARGGQSKGRAMLKSVLQTIRDANAPLAVVQPIVEKPEVTDETSDVLQSTGTAPLQDPAIIKDESAG